VGDPATAPVLVRRAVPADEAGLHALLTGAARWWATVDPPSAWPDPFPIERIRLDLAENEVYLAERPGSPEPLGCLTLLWADPDFWGERPPDAGYLHRITSVRTPAGRGVGRLLIGEAIARVRASGRPFVRLDTAARSAPLLAYYTSLGFAPAGRTVFRGVECVLFERPSGA
jgi:protein-tyrosine phosphatase